MRGTTRVNSRQRDEQETRNAAEVMEWVEHLARQPDLRLDLNLICHLNRLTLSKTDRDYWAGRVRSEVDWQQPDEWTRQRAIVALEEPGLAVEDEHTGELLVQFPPDRDVGPMLAELLGWINSAESSALHPVVGAALFHQRFTAIHPFRDGNGRTARALTTLLLWQSGFPAEILVLQRVLDDNRSAYIDALRAADRGDVQRWVQFFAQALADTLKAD